MYFESCVIIDLIKNLIIGWKKEYFFFYVKMSDFFDDIIKEMFIDFQNALLLVEVMVVDNVWYQFESGGFNWLKCGMDCIMKYYFWDEGEDFIWFGVLKYYQYFVYYCDMGIFDLIMDKDDMLQGVVILFVIDVQDFEVFMMVFEYLCVMGFVNMFYEDFFWLYGVNIKDLIEGKFEFFWYLLDWQYLLNMINLEMGVLISVVLWVFKQFFCECKFFMELGFVIGFMVIWFKMYMGGQFGYVFAFL